MTEKKNNYNFHKHSGSFRDPSGAVFYYENSIYRQINFSYQKHYERLMQSGLYNKLVEKNLIISHQEVEPINILSVKPYKTIKPEFVRFVSYPYEWSFSQYQDAALATLAIQKLALEHGMTLKDASAYNIQFHQGLPKLIDTLSFEIYEAGKPWIAYKQFCQHFLAPLALMADVDIRLNYLMRLYIDGLPLDLASRLLPKSSYLKLSLLTHLHLHAISQKRYGAKKINPNKHSFSKKAMQATIDNLETAIKNLKQQKHDTEWGDYYDHTNYQDDSFTKKTKIISDYIGLAKPTTAWDLGANTGLFSRLASDQGIFTVAFDIDPAAVEKNYQLVKRNKEKNILPLLLDLTNPSPSIGWANEERDSLTKRGPADLCLALALVHHLAISNNLPFAKIAEFFASSCRHLIIEFVPKSDSNTQRLLQNRQDIFDQYDQDNFEKTFSQYFELVKKDRINSSERILYLYKTK